MKFMPHPYQTAAISKIINDKSAGLFLDMGLGWQDSHYAHRNLRSAYA